MAVQVTELALERQEHLAANTDLQRSLDGLQMEQQELKAAHDKAQVRLINIHDTFQERSTGFQRVTPAGYHNPSNFQGLGSRGIVLQIGTLRTR
jgi:hypothetical protein